MENLDRSEERLENIQTVEPIIAALRTISLGGWRASLKRKRHVEQLLVDLTHMASALPLSVYSQSNSVQTSVTELTRSVLLVVGSERGLCGRFNSVIADRCEEYLNEQKQLGYDVELVAVGSRISHVLRRRGLELTATHSLSGAAVPAFDLCLDLSHQWLKRYETGDLQSGNMLYNRELGGANYEPVITSIIPPSWPVVTHTMTDTSLSPPIIETDPLRLFAQIIEQSVVLRLYQVLLESRAVEHLARYQLTEAATQNIERLIDELKMANQMEVRKKITREMQELAVASGLLESSSGKKPSDAPVLRL